MKKLNRQNRAGVAALSNQDLRTVAGGQAMASASEGNVKAQTQVRASQAKFEE